MSKLDELIREAKEAADLWHPSSQPGAYWYTRLDALREAKVEIAEQSPHPADLLHEVQSMQRHHRRIRELADEALVAHTRGAHHVVRDRLVSIMEQAS